MKVLALYDYPPSPGGLATQGDLLYRGLKDMGVDVYPAHFESPMEKEWYYRWFEPDIVVGIGFWGHTPHIIMHPQTHQRQSVPWLVANGFVASYHEILNNLPLVLTTSNWVTEVYQRDGIDTTNFRTLPVGCDTDKFCPVDKRDPKVKAIRQSLGIADDQLMILTIGGDAASKGAQEIMQALSQIDANAPDYKYVCKVWPQGRTNEQNRHDLKLAADLGIDKNVVYLTSRNSRDIMPYLIAACDIYAAPSRLEGFGMIQVEANACEKPVIGLNAMGMKDTMVHGETALLANIATEIRIGEAVLGEDHGFPPNHRVVFNQPRVSDYRASIYDLADHLKMLMSDADLRIKMGKAGRQRVVKNFDYRVVARKFVDLVSETLNID